MHGGQRILVRGGGRIALASAGTLRLAAGTNIEIDSAQLLRLTDGDLYVDIPPERSASVHLAIVTPAGTFTHLGTQFQLAVHAGQTQLRVREGQVRWSSANHEVLAGPGTQLSIDRDGHATREQIVTTGADWGLGRDARRAFRHREPPRWPNTCTTSPVKPAACCSSRVPLTSGAPRRPSCTVRSSA